MILGKFSQFSVFNPQLQRFIQKKEENNVLFPFSYCFSGFGRLLVDPLEAFSSASAVAF
jgi:hypothetical protein